jgi:hypothetical protein
MMAAPERRPTLCGGRAPLGALASLALALASLACRGGSEPPTAGPAARRYDVRAEVVALPTPGKPERQLTLRHEAIPGFVDRSGAVVGMGSMVMALDLAPSVATKDLRVGDKVEVRLAVDWSRPLVQIEEVRKLPPETVLHLDPAAQPPVDRSGS